MELLSNIFVVIFLLSIIAIPIGLIKPRWVIKWGKEENKTRKNVIKTYGIILIASFVLIAIITPTPIKNTVKTTQKEVVQKNTLTPGIQNNTYLSFLIISTILLILFVFLFIQKSIKHKKLYNKFKDVIDIEKEAKKLEKELQNKKQSYEKMESEYQRKESDLKNQYSNKRHIYEQLLKEISILEEDLELISFGMYKPHFDFDTSEKYKTKIKSIRSQQKQLIKNKNAAICYTQWEVAGSKREGKKMINRNIKLILRAFNNECDASIAKVKWNNVQKMEQRIKKAHQAINKLGEPIRVSISHDYLNLKLQELYLVYERQEKLYQEKEEKKRIKEEIREQKRVEKEIEKAKKEAEKEEKRYKKALEKARKEITKAQGEKLNKLTEQITLLEKQLKDAQDKGQRAISRAQITKSGYVYIISNIGSFGENIYKIGMTRRLEPLDRVRELGDASVPFKFDVHAMIYSENAPELERKLHKKLEAYQVNLVNSRKEFFNVSLEKIEDIVSKINPEIEFVKIPEAQEYRESIAIRNERKNKKELEQKIKEKFPAAL
nr:DUF4041 domain-containing protein [Orenia metallireducens]